MTMFPRFRPTLGLAALLSVLLVPGMALAVCGDGVVDGAEVCDDGNVVGGDCCAANCLTADTTCALGLDHFKCYQTRLTPGTPPFLQQIVSLTDQFETVPMSTIKRARQLCNNVSKNSEPIIDPMAHLVCYTMKDDRSLIGKFGKVTVDISNQFGPQRIVVKKPHQLCVPSAKAIAPAAPGPIPEVDHYRCYKAQPAPGSAVPPDVVTLSDQFERRLASVTPCFRFCNPVSKNGAPILNDEGHLACYRLKDLSPKEGDLYGVVGFGSSTNVGAVLLVDDTTGAGLVLGTPVAGTGLSGVVFDATGRLFATTVAGGSVSDLIEIDPDSGALLTNFGTINDGVNDLRIADLAVQPGSDDLYGVAAPNGRLYTIDKATAAATLIGDPGLGDTGGLAFAPDGTLYAMAAASQRLLTLDPATGAILTNVAADRGLDGLVVRDDGVIFGTQTGMSDLIVTIATNGMTTVVGNTGAGDTSDLAFRNTDPLPRVNVNVTNQFGDLALTARRKTAAYLCLPTLKTVVP